MLVSGCETGTRGKTPCCEKAWPTAPATRAIASPAVVSVAPIRELIGARNEKQVYILYSNAAFRDALFKGGKTLVRLARDCANSRKFSLPRPLRSEVGQIVR
jgi:hypothetical protein